MVVTFDRPLHTGIDLFFDLLIIAMFVRIILSWLQLASSNPVMRFFSNVADPITDPLSRRLPRIGVGAFDIGRTLAFIFMFWALRQIDAYILYAMPYSW